MHTQNVRRAFLRYFQNRDHKLVPSSPVVPHDDPTLLFTNAGMNQFKDLFLGKAKRDYTRAASSQKCIRVGGKHNDLENVGHTKRHLTFFEMLGNFSFGDYFKKEAIDFAWDVSTTVFGFDPKKIYPSVYEEDQEAFDLWLSYVPAERISKMGKKDNYWEMGDTGPCGPCSELYYDRGDAFGNYLKPSQNPDGERFLEFWNLVFMQYNRLSDGSLEKLPNPSIDTGAGLERVVLLQMGVDTLFETDLIRSIIAQIEQVSGVPYDMAHEHLGPAFRVVADHLRSLSFAIADGVQPGNVDRGYVLRKILRRAVRYGKNLGFEQPFLAKILPRLVDLMGDDFPELKLRSQVIGEILTLEEESFFRTLHKGGGLIKQVMEQAEKKGGVISGQDSFKLKDTYGLPLEEILLLAKDAHLKVDLDTYNQLEQEAKERSRQKQKSTAQVAEQSLFNDFVEKFGASSFVGYENMAKTAKVVALMNEGVFVNKLEKDQMGLVFLDSTPFYAEMGGQVGDRGELKAANGLFVVENTTSPYTQVIAHAGVVKEGTLEVGQTIEATVDAIRRQKIANNHSATHLLHYALEKVLGPHVKQAGSVVDPTRLRFDFSHHKAVSEKEIEEIEALINEKIREAKPVKTYEMSFTEASKEPKIKQFFGDKYGDKVRVVDIDYSKELCGGTHTTSVGTLGLFKVAKEGSIASGVRRIEAVTGAEALELTLKPKKELDEISALLKVTPEKALEKIKQLLGEKKELETQLTALQSKELESIAKTLKSEKQLYNNVHLLTKEINLPVELLRDLAELLVKEDPTLVLFLANSEQEPSPMLIRVGDALLPRGLKAGDLMKSLSSTLQGTGGGKPSLAQGAFKEKGALPAAYTLLKEQLLQL